MQKYLSLKKNGIAKRNKSSQRAPGLVKNLKFISHLRNKLYCTSVLVITHGGTSVLVYKYSLTTEYFCGILRTWQGTQLQRVSKPRKDRFITRRRYKNVT